MKINVLAKNVPHLMREAGTGGEIMKTVLLRGTALAVAFCAMPVLAQTAPDPAPAASTAQPAGLTDIIVTAQRRSENLQKAAVAVTAVTGDALVAAGVSKPAELTALVPALQVQPASGPYNLFYLRGVGNFNGNALSDGAVAFNFDGVYVGRPSATTGFFYDLDRVEVLKGPQGTLYGRNATGGAINVLSRKPQLGGFGGNASVEYGNYNAVTAEGAVNVPLGDKVALRAAGTYVSHDGYMKDGTDDQKDGGGRLSLLAEPDDTLKILLVADFFRQRGAGQGGTPVELGVDGRDGFLSPQGQAFMAKQPNTVLGTTFTPLTTRPYLDDNYWGLSGTIDWRTSIGTLTIVPAYREGSVKFLSETPGFYLRQREKDSQSSIEARLASSESHPLRYLLGAFYYHEINDVPEFYVNQQSNVNLDQYRQRDESEAVFGRLTYAVTPVLRFTAGARYTHETKGLDGTLQGAVRACTNTTSYYPTYTPGCPNAVPMPLAATVPRPNFNPFIDGSVTIPSFVDNTGANALHNSVGKFTYRVAADWDVSARNLVYASYETGFKSGGFYFTSDNGVFQPEHIEAWTIGAKNRFMGNRLQLNLEAFYWRYSNQQITHLILDSAGNAVFGTQNVGRASYRGIEIETRYLATPTTELNADLQYLDAKYDAFVYQTPNQNGGHGNGTACPNVGTPGANYLLDCSGQTPPYAPKWTINLGARQTIPLADGGRFMISARSHFQTNTLTGLEFLPNEYQPAYWLVDGDVTYAFAGDRITITGYLNNAFNKTVVANSGPVPFSFYTATSLRPPRTYGARLAVKF